jgi:CubicO group peptidase (beta-lactamase class C family)
MPAMRKRPDQLSLANWRQSPFSAWSFHHIRELLPTENIAAGASSTQRLLEHDAAIDAVGFAGPGNEAWTLPDLCRASDGEALLLSHRGRLVHEWYAHEAIAENPHLLFSVSKSMIGTLVGVFVENYPLDLAEKVSSYLPEVVNSGFADCTVQQLLDMTTSLDFEDFTPIPSTKVTEYWASTGWNPAQTSQPNPGLHAFLLTLEGGANAHGLRYEYQSPNTDLLGRVLERVSGCTVAQLFSAFIWQPLQAEADASVTVDGKGAARSAGGMSVLPRDLLRFGEMMLNDGWVGDSQVIPTAWVQECFTGGDNSAWKNGDSSDRFPGGGYRNGWYQTGNAHASVAAIGLHGQWLYIDPVAGVVIVKNSAQTNPLNDLFGPIHIAAFEAICRQLSEQT